MTNPVGADTVDYVQVSYAAAAFDVGQLHALLVANSQFSYDQPAFTVAGTDDEDPLLGALPCVPPYLSVVDAVGDWFGPGRPPGVDLHLLSFLGVFIPGQFGSLYRSLSTLISVSSTGITDNTAPFAIYSCLALGVTALPVSAVNFVPLAHAPLWPNLVEKP